MGTKKQGILHTGTGKYYKPLKGGGLYVDNAGFSMDLLFSASSLKKLNKVKRTDSVLLSHQVNVDKVLSIGFSQSNYYNYLNMISGVC